MRTFPVISSYRRQGQENEKETENKDAVARKKDGEQEAKAEEWTGSFIV